MQSRMVVAAVVVAAALFGLPIPSGAVNATQPTLVSTNPADYTPFIKDDPAVPGADRVNSVTLVSHWVVLGGNFTTVKNYQGGAPLVTRRNIMAFDTATGAISTSFVPAIDGEVLSVRAAGDAKSVFVGGKFHTVNGVAAAGLVKLDVATGKQVTAFNATTNGWVDTLVVHGSRVYLGGTFTTVRGVVHPYLAAVDRVTGAIDPNLNISISVPLQGALKVQHLDVSPAGDRLVMLGDYENVGGQPRSQLAIIDLSTTPASVAPWKTDGYRPGVCFAIADTYVRGVDISPDGRYFVVVTTGAWHGTGTLCDTAARWELYQTGTAIQPTWVEYTGGDTLTSVAVTGTAVYVGGHQRWMNNSLTSDGNSAGPGAAGRNGLAALDPVNGMAYSWNPGRDRGVGVFDMVATSNGLYIGHDTDNVGGEYHPRITFFPLSGGSAVPTIVPPRLPATMYNARSDNTLLGRSYNGSSFGTPKTVDAIGWSHVRGGFIVNHVLYTGLDNGHLVKRSFDGKTFGAAVDLGSWTSFATSTGMFFLDGRLYFTLASDPKLYYRKFEPEDGLVGTQLFVASGNGDGLDWRATAGMTTVAGKVYVADTAGNLSSIVLSGDVPVPASKTRVSGPTVDGQSWRSTAIFVDGPRTK